MNQPGDYADVRERVHNAIERGEPDIIADLIYRVGTTSPEAGQLLFDFAELKRRRAPQTALVSWANRACILLLDELDQHQTPIN